jgi:hypothetical protein
MEGEIIRADTSLSSSLPCSMKSASIDHHFIGNRRAGYWRAGYCEINLKQSPRKWTLALLLYPIDNIDDRILCLRKDVAEGFFSGRLNFAWAEDWLASFRQQLLPNIIQCKVLFKSYEKIKGPELPDMEATQVEV